MHFGQVTEVFREIRQHAMDSTEQDLLQYLIDCDLVFLDDLDKAGELTKFQMESLRLFIDKRYRDVRPIIISANRSLDQLLDDGTIDSAIHSRCVETCQIYELGNIDRRATLKKKLPGR